MAQTITYEYEQFEAVALRHDPENNKRVVTAQMSRGRNNSYELSIGAYQSWHLEQEIERWKDKKTQAGYK